MRLVATDVKLAKGKPEVPCRVKSADGLFLFGEIVTIKLTHGGKPFSILQEDKGILEALIQELPMECTNKFLKKYCIDLQEHSLGELAIYLDA